MPRRRYTADQLLPVRRILTPTYRRHAGVVTGTRQECWEALSAGPAGEPDGLWSFARVEDRGSPWVVKHLPTDFVPAAVQWSTLDDARHDAHTGRIWADLWHWALWELDLREHRDPLIPVNGHDRARAFLTWAAERGHDPTVLPEPVDSVMVTG